MNIFKTIAEDIRTVKSQDPASANSFVIWLTYSGLHARWSHVIEHWLWNHHLKSIARISSQFTRFMTGVEIHPAAQIGRRFFIDHGMGVIIGETTIIGDDVTLYQGVTLGGTGNETGKRHPTLCDNVLVGVGAAVLGNITIGSNSKVGGGAVVVDDVPANCTVVGIPGHIVVRDGRRVEAEIDEAAQHRECLPDPMAEELLRLRNRIEALEKNSGVISGDNAIDNVIDNAADKDEPKLPGEENGRAENPLSNSSSEAIDHLSKRINELEEKLTNKGYL